MTHLLHRAKPNLTGSSVPKAEVAQRCAMSVNKK
nr:MAG TPA: hypothetical protein [Caudoviricetes sp.]